MAKNSNNGSGGLNHRQALVLVFGVILVLLGLHFMFQVFHTPNKTTVQTVWVTNEVPAVAEAAATSNPEPMVAPATNVTSTPQAERVTFRVNPKISFDPRPTTTNNGHN